MIGQRNNAIAQARVAINKHNDLIDKLDLLSDTANLTVEQIDGQTVVRVGPDQPPVRDRVQDEVAMDCGTPDGALVEKQTVASQATGYKIGQDVCIKKEDHTRQLEAEQQRTRRLTTKNLRLQDNLSKYGGK